ncbi:MAG: glycosyltransferase family 4 protein [Brevundimonas sp.]|jgi:glycosyltransferase involved in cell wall biosynthesis
MTNSVVAYVYPYAFQYRLPFHERLREILAAQGVEYRVYYCSNPHFPARGDFQPPEWAIDTECAYAKVGSMEVRYQRALSAVQKVDLVIVQQENGLLLNYVLQLLRAASGRKVAFFGHGQNFQSAGSKPLREAFKRLWITQVDWWFAYTERSAEIVRRAGYPAERITAFNNAIDTGAIGAELARLDDREAARVRSELCDGSNHIGVYIGGLYDLKRIPFLIEAAQAIRQRVPDFHLLVIGGGPDRALVEAAAKTYPWIHALGPRFGAEKTLLASLGRVFLMPGLVGLSVLDSFAYDTPMVTTDLPYHSPEIDYLKDGVNGVIVREAEDVDAYADAVTRILTDEAWRAQLQAGAAEALQTYTVEAMAQRFADGVIKALES